MTPESQALLFRRCVRECTAEFLHGIVHQSADAVIGFYQKQQAAICLQSHVRCMDAVEKLKDKWEEVTIPRPPTSRLAPYIRRLNQEHSVTSF